MRENRPSGLEGGVAARAAIPTPIKTRGDVPTPGRTLGVLECGGRDAAHGGEDAGRFMGSSLFEIDLLTGHEPRIPGGETPPSTAGGTPAATDERFMERKVFQKLDTYWGQEPGVRRGDYD